ncbi:MAG TPA: T9SS type A sorting domain-containing protein [Saprospiraceae bacterium]|nr:T9SS type A sorting domain-containing protein [Saprospiraceae bacterium]
MKSILTQVRRMSGSICILFQGIVLLLMPQFMQAQKDLSLNLILPETQQEIIRYKEFNFRIKVSNSGVINIVPKDLIEVNIQLFGNNVYTAIVPHAILLPGDTIIFADDISFNFSAEYHGEQFCSSVSILNNFDPIPDNNQDCKLVDLLLYPTATIEQNEMLNDLSVFPNPSDGLFTLNMENTGNKIHHIKIFDANAVCIYQSLTESNSQTIDLAKHSKGLYYIEVLNDQGSFVKKIIIR